ncbi:MAG TPA: hypothetical protein DHW63_06590 [Hyphomonadaceae bacterium]|nr:hypothetical protein [Hyphomonadaceae bacterium]
MTPIIVDRELKYFGDSSIERGLVQVHAPEPDQIDWRCAYRIEWPGHEFRSRAIGIDAWQALQLAMYIVPSQIFSTADFKQGRIGLWDKPITTYEAICEEFGVKPVGGPKQ